MRGSNFFVYLLILLFFSLVGWLFYASFQHMQQGDTSFKEGVGKTLSKANEKTKDMIASAGEKTAKATNRLKNKGKNLKDTANDTDLYYDKEDDANGEAIAKDLKKSLAERDAKVAANQKAAAEAEKLAKQKAAEAKADKLTKKGNASKDIVVKEPKASTEKINAKPLAKNTPKAYNSVKSKSGSSSTIAKAADEYFVIAGSFSVAANAANAAKDFQKKGYKETEVVSFASTKYKSVSIKRFSTRAAADKMIAELKKKDISAYVHKKRFK